MIEEIDRNLVDSEVKSWILPNFSTTTDNDIVTAGVVFMSTVKQYFEYSCILLCGIPNVTLEGTIEDWKDIHSRLEKLKEFQLQKWYDKLEPILHQFVSTKEGNVDSDFWKRICHYDGGSGSPFIFGWLTAFCSFNAQGDWIDRDHIAIDRIPSGIAQVDVKIKEDEKVHETVMLAGHMASAKKVDGNTLQPATGWAICLTKEGEMKGRLMTNNATDFLPFTQGP